LIHAIYSVVLGLGILAYTPVLLVRRLQGKGYGRSFAQRFGRYGRELPAEPRCWIHAVSVGEAATAVPLVEGIARRWPELTVVMTTVTPTGARVVADRLNGKVTHRYFPLDLPGPVRRALAAVRPRFFIGMETELWPNFLRALERRRVPSMIANGRISDRSFKRYHRVRFLTSRMLRDISVFAMQSQEDARRIIALGARPERVVVTGNLKTDLAPPRAGGEIDWLQLLDLGADDLVWIAGSTHRGEEAMVLDVFGRLRSRFPRLVLLLAPRHPERVPEVERLAAERGLATVRRSELPRVRERGTVIILDTVGELARIYEVATVVFIGGSLVPTGGHNMLEPALLEKPVLFGAHTTNFRESAELLLAAGGAALVEQPDRLEARVGELLADAGLRARMGEAGLRAIQSRQGAVKQTIELVERYLVDGAHA
jgi:3-deoxy-D-manno-octulosonic-acid transferase